MNEDCLEGIIKTLLLDLSDDPVQAIREASKLELVNFSFRNIVKVRVKDTGFLGINNPSFLTLLFHHETPELFEEWIRPLFRKASVSQKLALLTSDPGSCSRMSFMKRAETWSEGIFDLFLHWDLGPCTSMTGFIVRDDKCLTEAKCTFTNYRVFDEFEMELFINSQCGDKNVLMCSEESFYLLLQRINRGHFGYVEAIRGFLYGNSGLFRYFSSNVLFGISIEKVREIQIGNLVQEDDTLEMYNNSNLPSVSTSSFVNVNPNNILEMLRQGSSLDQIIYTRSPILRFMDEPMEILLGILNFCSRHEIELYIRYFGRNVTACLINVLTKFHVSSIIPKLYIKGSQCPDNLQQQNLKEIMDVYCDSIIINLEENNFAR